MTNVSKAAVVRGAAYHVLRTVESALTLPVFLLAWWGSSLCRAVQLGWAVSGMKTGEKRSAIKQLLGEPSNDAG